MNCKQPAEKRLGGSASEIVNNTRSLEKAKNVRATDASGTMNLKNYKK